MSQIACCSYNCPRCMNCKKYFNSGSAESYYTFGSGSMDANGCNITCYCGELGHWGYYEPLENSENDRKGNIND